MFASLFNTENTVSLSVLSIACILFGNVAFAGEVIYPIDSYDSGQLLEHEDLNSKFNQIRSAVNDNNAKSTLDDLSCISGQVAMWEGANWVCADTAFVVSESETNPNLFLLVRQTPVQAARPIQSAVVSVPGPGSVVVSFSAGYRISHTANTLDEIDIGISENDPDAVVTSLASWRHLSLSSDFPTGVFHGSVATNAEFSVPTAGMYTYYILGASNKNSETNAIYVNNAATQAIFIPER